MEGDSTGGTPGRRALWRFPFSALLDTNYSRASGTFRDGGEVSAFRDGKAVQEGIPEYSDRTVASVVAATEYIRKRYGRFPAYTPPFRTVVAHQAHHLDLEF